jgi:hypothetical protein
LLPPQLMPEFGWVDMPFHNAGKHISRYFVMKIFVM